MKRSIESSVYCIIRFIYYFYTTRYTHCYYY